MPSLCHLRPVLPLHNTVTNTANPRHSQDILHSFSQVSKLAILISQKHNLKNYLTIATNNFMITIILTKLNFILPNLLEDNNFNLNSYNRSRYFCKLLLDDKSFYHICIQGRRKVFQTGTAKNTHVKLCG